MLSLKKFVQFYYVGSLSLKLERASEASQQKISFYFYKTSLWWEPKFCKWGQKSFDIQFE